MAEAAGAAAKGFEGAGAADNAVDEGATAGSERLIALMVSQQPLVM